MAIDLDAVAEEIRKRHGIKISKDDPLMMVVTILALMEQESSQYYQVLWAESLSKMEAFMTRCNNNAKDASKAMMKNAATQAQDIINKTLLESRDVLQKAVAEAVQAKTADIKAQLEQSIERARLAANTTLIAACAAVLAAGLGLWVLL